MIHMAKHHKIIADVHVENEISSSQCDIASFVLSQFCESTQARLEQRKIKHDQSETKQHLWTYKFIL